MLTSLSRDEIIHAQRTLARAMSILGQVPVNPDTMPQLYGAIRDATEQVLYAQNLLQGMLERSD